MFVFALLLGCSPLEASPSYQPPSEEITSRCATTTYALEDEDVVAFERLTLIDDVPQTLENTEFGWTREFTHDESGHYTGSTTDEPEGAQDTVVWEDDRPVLVRSQQNELITEITMHWPDQNVASTVVNLVGFEEFDTVYHWSWQNNTAIVDVEVDGRSRVVISEFTPAHNPTWPALEMTTDLPGLVLTRYGEDLNDNGILEENEVLLLSELDDDGQLVSRRSVDGSFTKTWSPCQED